MTNPADKITFEPRPLKVGPEWHVVATVIDGQSRTESRTELLPRATDREPVAELSAEETTAGPLPPRLALLLIALGLSTLAGSLIFKLSAAVQAGRRDVFRSR
jgi:hypothetical protein